MQSTRRGVTAAYRLVGDNLACSFRNQSAALGGAQRRQCTTEAKKLPPGTSEASRRLFQKVLDGQHIPPEEAAAPSKQAPTAFGRVLGVVGNLMFYGTLVGCTGFWASRYIYSLEETQQMAAAAEEAEQSSPNFFTQTYASAVCSYRDARVWLDQKMTEMTEPPSDMLLPDQHPLQQAHKLRTLVLDVDDVLVQSSWNRGVGWKTFKRPGASDLLDVLCRQYELVVFANRPHSYVDPILNRVDPGIVRGDGPTIAYRLYKNANSIRGNEHVRDLSKLNRDLSRTLFIVGESRAHTVLQQENVLVIPDWKGMDPTDTTLLDILPLLEILSKQDVLDVRVVCQSYKDTDVVQEFRNRMEAAAAQASIAKTAQPSRSRFGF